MSAGTPGREQNDSVAKHVRLPRALWRMIDRFAAEELPGASTNDVVRLVLTELMRNQNLMSLVRTAHYEELAAREEPS